MSYNIIISKFAEKQLMKLPKVDQKRISSTLRRCRIRPYPHIKKLVGSRFFRLRVGNYRVIMDIIDKKLVIHVIEIGHRKRIYKKY